MDSPVPCESDAAGGSEEGDSSAVNPAPPPGAAAELDTVLHSDAIGDTLFSERGVLRTLLALNAAVPRYLGLEPAAGDGGDMAGDAGDAVRDTGDNVVTAESGGGGMQTEPAEDSEGTDAGRRTVGSSGEPATGSAAESDAVNREKPAAPELALMELDTELEEQLCRLWDMSAERDVAEFLARSSLLDVAWPLLDRSPCPRLLEILAGTLANCAGHGPAALPGGAATAASVVGQLIGNSRGDAPVLRETLRLAQAAVCAQPEPEPLLRALSGWLPLLTEVLRGALSAPLLRQALGLLVAVAELPGRRGWWLSELAAVDELPAAVLEGLAQLVSGGGTGGTADEALDCCRSSLVLLAEVEAVEGAVQPASDVWLAPVPRLVRGVCDARRAAAAAADPRLACCLLWLAAPGLRRCWSDDTLAALLRFCDAALRSSGGAEPLEDATAPATDPGAARQETAAMEDEAAEARAELAARLDATAAFVARHCADDAARFVWAPERRRVAALLLEALERTDPELARRLQMPLQSTDGGDGTYQL